MREKRRENPLIMVDGVFVCALNENRTRGLPLRRRTLYPLSYKGVASFRGLGDAWPCMSGTTNIESSVEGKSIRRAAAKLLLLDSNQDQRFQRPVCCRYTKEECARTHRTRMPDCVPPCRSNPFFADWIPGPIPWPITADRLADGARVELARDFRPNSLSRTAPLPHGPPSMPVFAIQGHTG